MDIEPHSGCGGRAVVDGVNDSTTEWARIGRQVVFFNYPAEEPYDLLHTSSLAVLAVQAVEKCLRSNYTSYVVG